MAKFIVRQWGVEEVLEFSKDTVFIGRLKDNEIVLRGEGISRRHAEIRRNDDETYTIIDLGSRNGTYLNGTRITEQKLKLGDQINIGDAVIIFEKEIVRPESAAAKQVDLSENFAVPTRQSYFGTVVVVIIIIGAIAGIVLWRLSSGWQPVTELAINNLLRPSSSFDNIRSIQDRLPPGWTVSPPESNQSVTVTSEEKYQGKNSLVISPQNIQTACAYDKIVIPPNTSLISFGGMVKSDGYNKSASGFRIEWFQEDDLVSPFLESCTDLVIPKDRWQEVDLSMVPVPPTAYAFQFSLFTVGQGSRTFFDEVKVVPPKVSFSSGVPGTAESPYFIKEIPGLKLVGYYNGQWALLTREGKLLVRRGNLVIKTAGGEISQGLSAAKTKAGSGEISRQIFFVSTDGRPRDWLDYRLNYYARLDSLRVSYVIPFQKLRMELEGAYLKYNVPRHLIEGKLKIRKANSIREVTCREHIKETNVTRIDLSFQDRVLIVKYRMPLDIEITPKETDLEISQGLLYKNRIARVGQSDIIIEVDFDFKPAVKNITRDLEEMLKKTTRLIQEEQFGEAIKLYHNILDQAEPGTSIYTSAQERLKRITDEVRISLNEIKDLVQELALIPVAGGDEERINRIGERAAKIIKIYAGTEYAGEAQELLNQAHDIQKSFQTIGREANITRLLNIAEGYFKESKWTLARVFLNRIIELNPPGQELSRAKEMLGKIPETE